MSGLIIHSIETILLDLPLRRLQRFSALGARRQSIVLIRVRSNDGAEGLGEATTPSGPWWGGESVETIKLMIDTYLAPLVVGQRADQIGVLLRRMDEIVHGNSFAKAGLEMALFDLLGKVRQQPLHMLLGGRARDRMPSVWPLATGDPGQEIEEAERKLAAGEAYAFKMKMGAVDLRVDVDRAVRVARAISPKAGVRVDPNERWSEMEANWAIPRLADAGVEVVEQPLPRWNVEGTARLLGRFTMPIMLDESVRTPRDMLVAANAGAASLVSLKIMKSGGLGAARTVADIATAAGAALYMGTFLESSLGTAANMQFCATIETLPFGGELVGPMLIAEDVVQTPAVYRDGALHLPDGNGLGVELDEAKVAAFRRDRNYTIHAPAGGGHDGSKEVGSAAVSAL
jgi:muconate/chloromuconate cycloisomerase